MRAAAEARGLSRVSVGSSVFMPPQYMQSPCPGDRTLLRGEPGARAASRRTFSSLYSRFPARNVATWYQRDHWATPPDPSPDEGPRYKFVVNNQNSDCT